MTTMTLDKEKFYYSIIAGAKEVLKQKNTLNAINVFPVADGDTGSNLASMMRTIINESQVDDSMEDTLKSIADAALIGARGNSGIIFAQYLNGLMTSLEKNSETISIEHFTNSAAEAVPYAYEAIEKPVEGTMITLMREWSEALGSLKSNARDFAQLLSHSFDRLKASLSKTTETLEVLKKHSVVDAGAKGFFHFIEGIMKFINDDKMDELYTDSFDPEKEIPKSHESFEDEDYRYCTEALVEGENMSPKKIRVAMHELGDSLVVAGNSEKVRLHIHTNKPQDVFYKLREFGHIIDQKVDDMRKQYEIVNDRKYDIALVTDSIADLPQDFIDRYQIQQIPLNLIIEDSNYYDKLTIPSARFYQFMDELDVYPTSAQPNQKQMENFFSHLSTYYDKIIVLSVSSKMSGTHNVFKKAAEQIKDKDKTIEVIDTRQNSGAQGLLVMRAAEMIDEGVSFKDVVETTKSLIDKTRILVSVKTLKYMVRSGRVSKVTGIIGKIANLKPVVSIDETGEGIILFKGLSLRSSNKKIRKHIGKIIREKGIDRYAIVHANAENRARQYEKTFTDIIGMSPAYTMDISTIVAMNAGIGTVAIAYTTK